MSSSIDSINFIFKRQMALLVLGTFLDCIDNYSFHIMYIKNIFYNIFESLILSLVYSLALLLFYANNLDWIKILITQEVCVQFLSKHSVFGLTVVLTVTLHGHAIIYMDICIICSYNVYEHNMFYVHNILYEHIILYVHII